MLLDIIILFIVVVYFLLIVLLIAGWLKCRVFETRKHEPFTKISIIIPVRNEKENICRCLESIYKQNYPSKLFEVIIVDDHSTDETADIVNGFIKNNNIENFRLIYVKDIDNTRFGKKHALNSGISSSKYDVIVTTDGDCEMGKNWLNTINACFIRHSSQMVIMPVYVDGRNRLFHMLQSLEFLSLAGVTGSSAQLGDPLMCNGANLAFKKDAFVKVGGYTGNFEYASGDDVFLLHKMKKAFPQKIMWLKSSDCVVTTKPLPNISTFFNQRVRWFSKNKAFEDKSTNFTGAIVSIFNILLVFSPLCFLFTGCKIWLFAWVIKIVVDFVFLMMVSSFFRKQNLMWIYPIAAIIYPFYLFLVFLLGLLRGSYTWKGRKIFQ